MGREPAPPMRGGLRRSRLLIAAALAAGLALLGGGAIATSYLTQPAHVHGKPISRSSAGGGATGRIGWPGHPLRTSAAQASRLAGFNVLTLKDLPGSRLVSVTYVPEAAVGNQPIRLTGGSVSLEYLVDGASLQVDESLDADRNASLDISEKLDSGSSPLCDTVEDIDGGQYIVGRCPDGIHIHSVMWKTLDGILVYVGFATPAGESPTPSKSQPAPSMTAELVEAIISHLR
jgi:hypothetical protein